MCRKASGCWWVRVIWFQNSLHAASRGFQMLSRMGYQAGQGIGRNKTGRVVPIAVEIKGGRQGLGIEQNRKRKKQFAEQQQKERSMHNHLPDLSLRGRSGLSGIHLTKKFECRDKAHTDSAANAS